MSTISCQRTQPLAFLQAEWIPIIIVILLIITDEYDSGGTVALLLQDQLTMLI